MYGMYTSQDEPIHKSSLGNVPNNRISSQNNRGDKLIFAPKGAIIRGRGKELSQGRLIEARLLFVPTNT